MEDQTRQLLDWSQWGRQWVDQLRKNKPLNRELERHLHKFDESFTNIGKKASRLGRANDSDELPILVSQAHKIQEQFHQFLRLVQQQEQDGDEVHLFASAPAKADALEVLGEAAHRPALEPADRLQHHPILESARDSSLQPVFEPVRETRPQPSPSRERIPVARPVPIGRHTLPPLPYAYDALEPHIDAETMRIHHDKLHQKYVDDLNKAELKLAEARANQDFDLVRHWERELAFNGAGHYLHTLFWYTMSPQGGGEPSGDLAQAIDRYFGSFPAFQAHFTHAAEKVEGPGWAILVWSPRSSRLEILTAEKHQNLSQWDVIPLLPIDVWEHSYFLAYKEKRPDYVRAWWNLVNWPYVEERFEQARKLRWQPY
ncbi:superoxide dismutase [Brevibacillus panacihumi]|uniref:superoxide dismutase n=1 Tax=Brevibacillus panacihumi TaxID=497735 RepID=A0A3M8DDJ0_9BACL|nr:superoxide dismutase [Brevibacillus panacihumi]RNB86152.1 superoxide dismutase [Brevibacillus panacihumi]